MKQPTMVRDRVLAGVQDMLEHLRVRLTLLPQTEVDVLKRIERPQQFDLAVEVANHLMDRLGHSTQPTQARFDKTRRRLTKKRGKPPRGMLAALTKAEREAQQEATGVIDATREA